MHAVFVASRISDFGPARESLYSDVIPNVSQMPGFVSGVWLAPAGGESGEGNAIVVFESEDVARAMAKRLKTDPPPNVEIVRAEVREVAGSASSS